MSDARTPRIAAPLLIAGALLGMAGTFAPSDTLRALLWGLDGTALVAGTALLTIHHARRGDELAAAGFLTFVAGETLIVAGSAMDLGAVGPLFGAGCALWAAAMALVSAPRLMPAWVRVVGAVGALLFIIVAIQIFTGHRLSPLTRPLPFFAYPFLAAALIGWAWAHLRDRS